MDELGQEVVETTGTLSLDGITADTFEDAKADIIQAIKQQVYDEYGVWLNDEDIVLSASDASSRRALASGFMLTFTVTMPADLKTDAISSDGSNPGSNSWKI